MQNLVPGPLPPTIAGFKPEPKVIKKKSWEEELNDLGRFLLGPHGDALFQAGEFAAGFTPGAEIQDALEASGQLSKGVTNLNPWEAGMGMAGLIAAFVPGPSGKKSMDLIHGSPHKWEAEGNHPFGKFREDKLLSGEGTNFEGAGAYLTDPIAADTLGKHYAHQTDKGKTLQGTIGDKDLHLAINEAFDKENVLFDPYTQKIFNDEILDNLGSMAAQKGEKGIELSNINDILATVKEKYGDQVVEVFDDADDAGFLPAFLILQSEPDQVILNIIKSLENMPVKAREAGGYIYDANVLASPESFLDLYMPIQYQDDKVISAVDEWLKQLPETSLPWSLRDANKGSDELRRKFVDDKYKVPYKELVPILGDQNSLEHAAVLKDLGLSGQKWFSRHTDEYGTYGGERRRLAYDLFEKLKEAETGIVQGTSSKARQELINKTQQEIVELQNILDNAEITTDNMSELAKLEQKIATKSWQLDSLKAMQKPDIDRIEADLASIYRNPPRNYVVNDPSKIIVKGRRFIPYGR